MSIDQKNVRDIAALARLALSEGEEALRAAQIDSIVKWIEQMSDLDTSGVEPLATVTGDMPLLLRKDEVTAGGSDKDILANAPDSVEGFFVVPKIVE